MFSLERMERVLRTVNKDIKLMSKIQFERSLFIELIDNPESSIPQEFREIWNNNLNKIKEDHRDGIGVDIFVFYEEGCLDLRLWSHNNLNPYYDNIFMKEVNEQYKEYIEDIYYHIYPPQVINYNELWDLTGKLEK